MTASESSSAIDPFSCYEIHRKKQDINGVSLKLYEAYIRYIKTGIRQTDPEYPIRSQQEFSEWMSMLEEHIKKDLMDRYRKEYKEVFVENLEGLRNSAV